MAWISSIHSKSFTVSMVKAYLIPLTVRPLSYCSFFESQLSKVSGMTYAFTILTVNGLALGTMEGIQAIENDSGLQKGN